MTALLATDALAPLSELLDRRYPGAYPAGLRMARPAGPPWRRGTAYSDPDRLEAIVHTVMRQYGANQHVAAALLWKTYTYRVVSPVVLGWALNRRVPLATAEAVMVRPGPGDNRLSTALVGAEVAVLPGDPLAGSEGTVTARDEDDLLARAGHALLAGHLVPVQDALAGRTKLGGRSLCGSVAEAAAHPLLIAMPRLTPDPRAAAARLLAAFGPPLADLLDLTPAPEGTPYRRRTCCLAFTLPQYGFCATCCIPRTI